MVSALLFDLDMAKYIDADLLLKEIKRLKDEYTDIAIDSQRGWVNAIFIIDDLGQLQSQIDSLQQEQPEVDLEKELRTYLCSDEYMNTHKDGFLLIASHFFNLGLKAKKEKNK